MENTLLDLFGPFWFFLPNVIVKMDFQILLVDILSISNGLFLWPRIKALIIGFGLIFMLDKINSYSHVFMCSWKGFLNWFFCKPFLVLLIFFYGHLGHEIMATFFFFTINNGCHDCWYIMHVFIFYGYFFVNLTLFSFVSFNLVLHASFEFNFILIWGLRRSVNLMNWSMTHSFGLHHSFFKLLIFRIHWFL